MPEATELETNRDAESPSTGSFRDRMRDRLTAERAGGEPVGAPEGYADGANPSDNTESDTDSAGYENALDTARQPEDGEATELDESTGGQDDPDGALPEDSDDPSASDVPAEHQELIQRAEEAETRAKSMERDYRVKTHKIAAATRELEDHSKVVDQQAQFILSIAEQGVTQFDQVNWQQLQTKPEEYQRMRQMFNQALQQRDHLKKQLGGIADQHKDLLEQAKGREAEVSRDILKTTISGWSNDLYAQLRTFATEELSYTAGEFDEVTDWRRLRDIHAQYQIAQAPTITSLRRKKGKQPVNRQRERQLSQSRNSKGQFQDARKDLKANPGDRDARRNFFQQKLAAERGR